MKEKARVEVYRFDPESDKEPRYETHEIDMKEGMTVIDALLEIKKRDPSFHFNYVCRSGQCGICGVNVNGKAVLACREKAYPDMKIKPFSSFPVKKDLIVNFDDYESRLSDLRVYLDRASEPTEEPEGLDMTDIENFKKASRCISCFCCVESCPAFEDKPHKFDGPAALVLEARHYFDPRDDLNRDLI
ncbi:MAG: succinate dehydrogenase/fumarate reductase iron-sulfur subunit, partial [Candidatus Saliniplasma sp.]